MLLTPRSLFVPGARPGRLLALLCTCALACLVATTANADGGHVALYATSGAYTITLFTAPVPLETGPCDLSLLVQDAATGDVLPDATAAAILTSPNAASTLHLTFTRRDGKPLLSADPVLRQPGTYALSLQVAKPGKAPTTFASVLAVAPNHSRRSTLIAAVLFPLLAIALFLVNQQAKRKTSLRVS